MIEPIKPIQISRAVIDRIIRLISEGYWDSGDRLPSQRDLAKSLGIGMSTLREAIQSLQTIGILEARHGEGTFVADNPHQVIERLLRLSLELGDLDVQSLFEARVAIESELAYYAALRASEEQIEMLFKNLETQRKAIVANQMDEVDKLDWCFHQLLAEMANSQFLQEIHTTLGQGLKRWLKSVPHTLEGHKLHLNVAESIKAADPTKSSQAARRMIIQTHALYGAYFEKEQQVEELQIQQSEQDRSSER